MHLYNKHLFLKFLMVCVTNVHSMNHYHDGAIVNISDLPNAYTQEVMDLDLNITLIEDNDYTTEEEVDEVTTQPNTNNKKPITASDNNAINTIYGMPKAEYFKWFTQNIQPQISKNKKNREKWVIKKEIRRFKKNQKIDISKTIYSPNLTECIDTKINTQEFNFLTKKLLPKYADFDLATLYNLYMNTQI